MNRFYFFRLTLIYLCAIGWSTSSAQLTNWEMAEKMGKGINLGNTLEAPTEGAWAMAAQPYFFEDYVNQGFTNCRIPVNWGNRADTQGNIDPTFMDRVEEVVDWSLAAGLVTVINIHHENWIISNYWDNKDRAVRIWEQISARFKNKSQDLIFELFNEPRDDMGAAEVTDFNNTVHPMLRAENPTRILIVGAGAWGGWRDLYNVSWPSDEYTMVQFHYYDPHHFTHVDQYEWWGHDQVRQDFAQFVPYIVDKYNIPLYCGEFGVMHSNDEYPRSWEAALAYYDIVSEVCVEHGVPYSVWDDQGWFGIYDRGGRNFNEILGALNCPDGSGGIVPPERCTEPVTIPGTVLAKDYCEMKGIQVETSTEGGLNVGYIEAGDWMSYRIDVPVAGEYTFEATVASKPGGGSFRLESADGSTIYGEIDVPATGDWQAWMAISLPVDLPRGDQEFKVVATGDAWNIHRMEIGTLTTVTEDYSREASMSIYPNPTTNQLTVDGSGFLGERTWTIYGAGGQLVKQGRLTAHKRVNTADLEQGVYFFEMEGQRSRFVKM